MSACLRCRRRRAHSLGYCSRACRETDRLERPDRHATAARSAILAKLDRAQQLEGEGRTGGAQALREVAHRWATDLDPDQRPAGLDPETGREETS